MGRVCFAAGLTKRYFYESFASLAELQSAVVDHAIEAMSLRVDPFRPAGPGGAPQAWLEAFVGALVDDERLARVLLAETHGGALSAFRHQIIDVAIAGMAPPDSDPQADLRACLVAYAQIGTLSELCLAWHGGSWRWSGRHSSACSLICLSASTVLVLRVWKSRAAESHRKPPDTSRRSSIPSTPLRPGSAIPPSSSITSGFGPPRSGGTLELRSDSPVSTRCAVRKPP